jgi:integrase
MPRRRNTVPKFSVASDGRAFTKVTGRFISLGRGDDPQAYIRFAAIVTGQAVEEIAPVVVPKAMTTLNELFLKYVAEELPRFSSSERHCQRSVIRITRQLFGFTPVADFGPLKLRAVRDAMVAGDPNQKDRAGKPNPRKPWSRNTVNRQVKRLRAIIRWGVSWEMVTTFVVDALDTVSSLTEGETAAAESIPRVPVSDVAFHAVRGVLREKHRDMLDLLSLTGARPGELLKLTTGIIDRSGPIWRCELAKHKTSHKGKQRVLFFNEAAQLILKKYLSADPDEQLLKMRRDNFGHVIQRACERAKVTPFCPYQIRHTVATKVVDEMGAEFAQRLLGHSKAAMTREYSKTAEKQAKEAVKRLG